ncbi:MAG: CDP-alcohol phosphatidyltransferase family protein, partial [Planctomycetota bacterium]
MRAALPIEAPLAETVAQETMANDFTVGRSLHSAGRTARPLAGGPRQGYLGMRRRMRLLGPACGALVLAGLGMLAAQRLGWVGTGHAALAAAVHGAALTVVVLRFRSGASEAEVARARLGAANLVTLLRTSIFAILLALALAAPLPRSAALVALGLGIAALVLDGIDGHFARSRGTASAFGAWFDQETDAALVAALALLGWRSGSAGAWILIAGALRYAFLVALWLAPSLRAELPFSQRRRVICVVQIAALLACAAPFLSTSVTTPIAAASVALL